MGTPRGFWGIPPAPQQPPSWSPEYMTHAPTPAIGASLRSGASADSPAIGASLRSGASNPSLAEMAARAKADRNRAIDFYRAIAMLAVAIGHWIAMVAMDNGGEIEAGNALSYEPNYAWATWILQVMPLFFVVGGFSSAMSLDAHWRKNAGTSADWIAARLRRMMPPAVVLAAVWLAVIVAAVPLGVLPLALAGVHAAAIPLWFLANYTIDTALAPFVLPRFRQNPVRFAALIGSAFGFFEILRIADVPVLPQVNWVLGWLIFQIAGMAWRDGLLPTGGRMAAIAAGFWVSTAALVLSGGPWAISMVNAPDMANSPTNPPTLALLSFGFAYSATAIAVAPAISRWLAANQKAWAAVVAANSIAMSVYLWHMTAAVIVVAGMYATIGLPSAAVGTAAWWMWKVPLVVASTVVLAPIVAVVSRIERAALLAPRRAWDHSLPAMLVIAGVMSAALKLWTGGNPATFVPALIVIVGLGRVQLWHRTTRTAIEA